MASIFHNKKIMNLSPKINDSNIRFFRIQLILIEGGRKVLLRLLKYRTRGIEQSLKKNERKLKELVKNKRMTKTQWSQLFPTPYVKQWDIGLIITLLQHISGVEPPDCSPMSLPEEDRSLGADLFRMRKMRNDLQGHIARAKISELEFKELYLKMTIVWKRLADGVQDSKDFVQEIERDIREYLTMPLDLERSTKMEKTIEQWTVMDSQENQGVIIDRLRDLSHKLDTIPSIMEANGEKILNDLETTLMKLIDSIDTLKSLQSDDIKLHVTNMTDKCLENVRCQLREAKENMKNDLHSCLAPCEIKQIIEQITKCYTDLKTMTAEGFRQQSSLTKAAMKKQERQHRQLMEVFKKCCFKSGDNEDIRESQKFAEKYILIKRHSKVRPILCPEDEDIPVLLRSGRFGDKERCWKRTSEPKVLMSCGHEYSFDALGKYVRFCVSDNMYSFRCLREGCLQPWEITEVRDILKWSPEENQFFEMELSRNYLSERKDIQDCPQCHLISCRQDERDIQIRCFECGFQFCWMCRKKWKSAGCRACGNSGCKTLLNLSTKTRLSSNWRNLLVKPAGEISSHSIR